MKFVHLITYTLFTAASSFAVESYFPKNSVSNFEQGWYADHLSAMKEPILTSHEKDKSYFAFRVLYLPTWGRPVAVRIERSGNSIVRRAVILSGSGGYDPGIVKEEKSTPVTADEFTTILTEIQNSGFWELKPTDDVMGFDGSQLIIEAIHDGSHRVFVRWSPEHDTVKRGLEGIVSLYSQFFREAGFWKKN